jgi:hypothetical protein
MVHRVKFEPADIWAMTPAELDELMRLAAWMCEYPQNSTGDDRYTIAAHLRRAASQVNRTAYDSLAGAAEYYRPGVYNGD